MPNSRTVWVLGILSLVGALCFALPGLIIAIIALFLSSDDEGRYRREPHHYTPESYDKLRTGKTMALIGLVLSLISLLAAMALM